MTNDLTVLGEKGFLAGLLPELHVDPRLVGGFGHDASVVELHDAPFNLILKIDRASHPVALKMGGADARTWGQMAITANCSDILASGGRPLACMIAVMVPGSTPAHQVRDIVLGAADECRARGVVYAGGDTKESGDSHVVGAAVGLVDKDGFLPRNTARPGDLLYCAGRIGGFAGAYFLLTKVPAEEREQPDHRYMDYLARPVAQWAAGLEVSSLKAARCGMDASDGVLDVLRTFSLPGVRAVLDLERIPYHDFALECAAKTPTRLTQLIFGGGDWNILYCVPPDRAATLDTVPGLFRIGEIQHGDGVFARDGKGRLRPVHGTVNEHFRSRIEDAGGFMETIEKGDFLG